MYQKEIKRSYNQGSDSRLLKKEGSDPNYKLGNKIEHSNTTSRIRPKVFSKSNSQAELTGHRVYRKVEFNDKHTLQTPADLEDGEKKANRPQTSNYNPINLKMNLVIQDSAFSKSEADPKQAQPAPKVEGSQRSQNQGVKRGHARHSSALGQITQYLQKKVEEKLTPNKRETLQIVPKKLNLLKQLRPIEPRKVGIQNLIRRASDHKLRERTFEGLNQTDSKSRLYHNIEIQEMSLDDEEN